MDNIKPPKLPLQADISRCLGHGDKKGEWCSRYRTCARNQTCIHIDEPLDEAKPPYYRMCSENSFASFMEFSE